MLLLISLVQARLFYIILVSYMISLFGESRQSDSITSTSGYHKKSFPLQDQAFAIETHAARLSEVLSPVVIAAYLNRSKWKAETIQS